MTALGDVQLPDNVDQKRQTDSLTGSLISKMITTRLLGTTILR